MKDADLTALANTLPAATMIAGIHHHRSAYLHKFGHEIAIFLTHLQRFKVIGHVASVHPDPPENCDICEKELSKTPWFVDGEALSGRWANMCPVCFIEAEGAIGWGLGQLYMNKGDGNWLLTAGGDPDAPIDDE